MLFRQAIVLITSLVYNKAEKTMKSSSQLKVHSKTQTELKTKLKSKLSSKLMAKVLAKSKQIPFNIYQPWDNSIAMQLGSSPAELKEKYPTDPTLASTIGGTCTLVRDLAIKELIAKNMKAAISLADICQGSGQVLHEGALVATGACNKKWANSKGVEGAGVNPGDGSNEFGATCGLKEGDVYIQHRRFFGNTASRPPTTIERLKNFNVMGEHNTNGLGAFDQIPGAFLQKTSGSSSNEELPAYFSPTLNGKGFTHNSAPVQRWHTKANPAIFDAHGYKTKPVAEGEAEGENPAEEGEALGTTPSKSPVKNFDQMRPVMKMVVPDFICSTICAGLDIEGLLEEGKVVEVPEEKPESNAPQLDNPHMNTEEGVHMNTRRQGQDKSVMPDTEVIINEDDKLNKDYAGNHECTQAAPVIADCLDKGLEIANWITERIVNKDKFCDQETGSCASLFAAPAA